MWLALVAGACGPIQASSAVGDAQEALTAAHTAEAHRHARYEYWSAVAYLDKAKRVEGRAEYEAAEDFAKRAIEFATLAVEAAGKEKLRQQVLQDRLKTRRRGDR